MPTHSILSLAPYRVLPATSGGQLCIAYTHHYLGKLCPDHMAGTENNDAEHDYSFQLHKVFPNTPMRYLPLCEYARLKGIARLYDCTHIICEHPYMAWTAMALSRKLKLPWFLRSHNIESERFREMGKPWWRAMRMYEGMAMRKAHGVFFLTDEDAMWAQQHYRLPLPQCHIAPFGTTLEAMPEGKEKARQAIATQLEADPDKKWLYFLGALDYKPNADAVRYILDEVLPRMDSKNTSYHIFIAGRKLAPELEQRIAQTANIQYTGFLPSVETLVKACDVMLNPVMTGGGIKTKAVEALGFNKNIVSSERGAAGLIREACSNKLLVTPDHDWDAFAEAVIWQMDNDTVIPPAFYDTYYWGHIARRMLQTMVGTKY